MSRSPKLYPVKNVARPTQTPELATFGAGCFWGVEQEFRNQKGVLATAVGYAGGHTQNPNYKEVCNGDTGHAEVVQVEYDSKIVSYEDLLKLFWDLHDPTTLNRQGPDVGSQYRSAVFFHDENQEGLALRMKDELQKLKRWPRPLVTEVTAATQFYPAEEYHQQYVEKGGRAVCHVRLHR